MWKETLFKSMLQLGQRLPVSIRLVLAQSPGLGWVRRLSQIPIGNGSVVMTLSAPLAGYRMRLDVGSGHRRFALGTYEPQIVALLVSRLKKNEIVMDIGANVGYFTLLMAHLVGSAGRVIAFEPVPEVYARLRENLRLNQCDWAQTEQLAIADTDGLGRMRAEIDRALSFTGQLAEDGNLSVPMTTLDNYMALADLKRLDLIKIDVEGAEDRLVRGMTKTLEILHPSVLVEIHRDDGQESEIDQWLPCSTQARSGHVFAV